MRGSEAAMEAVGAGEARGESWLCEHGLPPWARLGALDWELSQCVGEISRHDFPGI